MKLSRFDEIFQPTYFIVYLAEVFMLYSIE